MRIAIDIDDTITRHPEFFSLLTKLFKAAGHEVHVITYRLERKDAESELTDYGIVYDELILATGEELDRVGFYEWKADVCRQKNIEVLFEDMPEVINELDPSTLALMVVDPALGKVTYVD
jgi:hypothetical protein